MKKILWIAALSLCVGVSTAQTNYDVLNGPFGGGAQKIVLTNSNTLLAIKQGVGVLRSVDHGTTWLQSSTGLTDIYALADLFKDTSGKLYTLSSQRLYISTDDGLTWTLKANSGFFNARFLRQGPSGNLFIATSDNAIHRSINGGTSWSQRITLSNSYENVVGFEFTSGGFMVIATTFSGIYRAAEGDLSAALIGTAGGWTDGAANRLISTGSTLYAISNLGPFKSTNNGANWTSIKDASMNCCFYSDVMALDPSGNLFLTNQDKIWKTTNGGTSWTSFVSPMPAGVFGNYSSFFCLTTSEFYLSIDGVSIFKTTNGGTNWAAADNGFLGLRVNSFLLTDNGRLLYARSGGYGVYVSLDDGDSWDFVSNGGAGRIINGIDRINTSPVTYMAFGNGLTKSIDNGQSWADVLSVGSPVGDFYCLEANDNGSLIYTLTINFTPPSAYNYVLWTSVNGGATFTSKQVTGLPSTPYFVDDPNFVLDDAGNLYVITYNPAASSLDFYKIDPATGAGTVIVNVPSGRVISMDARNGKLYATTDDGHLYVSDNGAASWSSLPVPTGYFGGGIIRIIDDNTFYILTTRAYLSTDGGLSWVDTGTITSNVSNYSLKSVAVSSANYSYLAAENTSVVKSKAPIIPPLAPSSLHSLGNSFSVAALEWTDNSDNEDYFSIEMSKSDNQHYDTIARAQRSNFYTRTEAMTYIQNLEPSSTYFFRVRASGPGGKSAYTNEVSVVTPADCSALSTIPKNRSWTASTLNISGENVPPRLNQLVTPRVGGGDFDVTDIALGFGNTLPNPPQDFVPAEILENCGSVFMFGDNVGEEYVPDGIGAWDESTGTITIPVKTHPQYSLRAETIVYTLNSVDPKPSTPDNLTGGVYTPKTILMGWGQSTFTTGYEIERSTTSGSGFVKIADLDDTFFTYKDLDPALVAGTTYYYRIRAISPFDVSDYSVELPLIPSDITNYHFEPFDNFPRKTFFNSGAGGSWGDLDGDGIEDLIIGASTDSLGATLSPIAFKSLGNGEFTKLPIPELAETHSGNCRNIVIADVNNDGLNDLFFTFAGIDRDFLLLKNANGSYTKMLMPYPISTGFGGASWIDFDNDGDLDLEVHQGAATVKDILMYLNDGTGALTPLTGNELASEIGSSRDVQWADFDNDGLLDALRVSSSGGLGKTKLFKNTGAGGFISVLGSAFETINGGHRTASWGDYDNDGDMDVYIGSQTAAAPTFMNRLMKNNGDGTFAEVVGSAVNEAIGTFGSAWADIDNDMDLDLIISGFAPAIYFNNGDGTFIKSTTDELFVNPNLGKLYGLSMADIDGDGLLDFFNGGFSGQSIPNFIYRNRMTPSSSTNWVKIKFESVTSNKSAIGVRVNLVANGISQTRTVVPHTSWATQSSSIMHFGLGSSTDITSLEIQWPSGLKQEMKNISTVNTTLVIPEDADPPVETVIFPANNATNSAILPTIELTLSEASIAIAGKKLRIVRESALGINVFAIDVTTATKAGNKYSFTLPGTLLSATAHRVIVEPGAFTDIYGNETTEIGNTNWKFTTGTIPVANVFSPAVNAADVSAQAILEITFDRSLNIVAGKKITVKDGTTTVLQADVAGGTFAGNKFTLDPAVDFPYLKLLEVTIEDGAFVDPVSGNVYGLAAGTWKFTIIKAPDVVPPTISFNHTPFDVLEKGFQTNTLAVTANDDENLASVTLMYRKISDKAFSSRKLTLNSSTTKWEGPLNSTDLNDMGLEYYFRAKDASGNKAYAPGPNGDSTTFYTSTISFAGSSAPKIQTPSQGTANSWIIISIPYELANNDYQIADIFGQALGNQSKSSWRLLQYKYSPQAWLDYPEKLSAIERGKGYFLNSKSSSTVTFTNAKAPAYGYKNLFQLELKTGWNLIGNPYTVPINWDDIIDYNNGATTIGTLRTFAGSNYTDGKVMLPGSGGFVMMQSDATVIFSFPGQTSGGRIQDEVEWGDLSSGNWQLKFTLTNGDARNEFGGIGMNTEASSGYDRFDDFNPPTFMDYVDINFRHPEHFAKRFARDVVPSQQDYVWEFEVDTNLEGPTTLSWDNTLFGDNSEDIFLYDEVAQEPVNMKEVGSFAFDSRISSRFKVFFGKGAEAKIRPAKVILGQAYPNPMSGATTIPFSIPENFAKFAVRLEVFDLMGKKVATLLQDDLGPGFYKSEWTPRDSNLADGIYTYRLMVGSEGKPEIHSGKLMLRK